EVLVGELVQRADQVYRAFEGVRDQRRSAIEAIDGDIVTAENRVRQVRQSVDTALAPLTAEELLPRNPDEAARDGATIRQRREIMRERRIGRAKQRFEVEVGALERLRANRAAICRELEKDLERSRSTARRLRDFYVLRISNYWEGVLRAHVDGR